MYALVDGAEVQHMRAILRPAPLAIIERRDLSVISVPNSLNKFVIACLLPL
jgi:hypothetical protein